jgi:hypothetical protein
VAALVVAVAAAVGRPVVAAVITRPAKAAPSIVEIAAAAAGVGRFAAAAIAVVADGKVTSAFPDNSIQKLFALV